MKSHITTVHEGILFSCFYPVVPNIMTMPIIIIQDSEHIFSLESNHHRINEYIYVESESCVSSSMVLCGVMGAGPEQRMDWS